MIKLMVSKKCHDCPQFSPTSDTIWESDKPTHFVKCLNADCCREIRRYLMDLTVRKAEMNSMSEGFDDAEG